MPLPVRRSLSSVEGGSFVALATGEGDDVNCIVTAHSCRRGRTLMKECFICRTYSYHSRWT